MTVILFSCRSGLRCLPIYSTTGGNFRPFSYILLLKPFQLRKVRVRFNQPSDPLQDTQPTFTQSLVLAITKTLSKKGINRRNQGADLLKSHFKIKISNQTRFSFQHCAIKRFFFILDQNAFIQVKTSFRSRVMRTQRLKAGKTSAQMVFPPTR